MSRCRFLDLPGRRSVVVIAAIGLAGIGWLAAGASAGEPGSLPLPSEQADFFEPGTQPGMLTDPVFSFDNCAFCHSEVDQPASTLPARWRGSIHAQSVRDPLFLAALAIANQDAEGAGETCLRCHSPRAWLGGRAAPPTGSVDGSDLFPSDRNEGINCNFCHRVVDPVYTPGQSPADDEAILDELEMAGLLPMHSGNAQYVVDPIDLRRGPRTYGPDDPQPLHTWRESPYHRSATLCGTCHDVSNPLLTKQPDGTYVPNVDGAPHPTLDPSDMFPEQRTFSEWANSDFPGGVDMGGRFGGNKAVVSTCQDCHMPDTNGQGCSIGGYTDRDDLAFHSFQGANRWIIDVLLHVYDGPVTDDQGNVVDNGLDEETKDVLALATGDVEYMLESATDVELTQTGGELNVRIINQCGHKLLTGYPEGRRIWINVRFLDAGGQLVREYGAYDDATATLALDTKVYEAKHGLDDTMAGVTGLPAGESFHLTLNNTILKDNRIPPRGFTNAAFEAIGSPIIGAAYADGQHWDDTKYCIPAGAADAEVRVYYQTASREYIEFLRDENTTNSAGQTIHDAWVATGKSAPFAMDDVALGLGAFLPGDANADGIVDFEDLNAALASWGDETTGGIAAGDLDCNGVVDLDDLNLVLGSWSDAL